MQAGTGGCRQEQADSGKCRQVQADAGRHRQAQVGAGRCRQMQAGTGRHRQMQAGAGRCRQMQAGTGRSRWVQEDAGRCRQMQAGAGRHREAAWPLCAELTHGVGSARAAGADAAMSPVAVDSRIAARDTCDAVISVGSKGQAGNFHFGPVSVFGCGKQVQFHQIQGKEPSKLGEMAAIRTVPASGLLAHAWAGSAGSGSPTQTHLCTRLPLPT